MGKAPIVPPIKKEEEEPEGKDEENTVTREELETATKETEALKQKVASLEKTNRALSRQQALGGNPPATKQEPKNKKDLATVGDIDEAVSTVEARQAHQNYVSKLMGAFYKENPDLEEEKELFEQVGLPAARKKLGDHATDDEVLDEAADYTRKRWQKVFEAKVKSKEASEAERAAAGGHAAGTTSSPTPTGEEEQPFDESRLFMDMFNGHMKGKR